ncbi:hypothetical protein GBA52_005475 [Prunus armeniaca]|nr:hypothetical protein GBA52_005475 [Prunus armeniaca]
MRECPGLELPRFSHNEKQLLRGSIDFIGFNHYSTLYVKDCIHSACPLGGDHAIKGFLNTTGYRDGVPIGEPTGMPRFFVVPRGMEKMLDYLKQRYNNKPMFITENGYSLPTPQTELQDWNRIKFHKAYMASVARAIRNGADVRGYFIWSLMDNFEWLSGYTTRFGLYYVDRKTLHRTPKLSAGWFASFLRKSSHNDREEIRAASGSSLPCPRRRTAPTREPSIVLRKLPLLQYRLYKIIIIIINFLPYPNVHIYTNLISRKSKPTKWNSGEATSVTCTCSLFSSFSLFFQRKASNKMNKSKSLNSQMTSYLLLGVLKSSFFHCWCREEFVHFASICFESFGDGVKYWVTINEPNMVADFAYLRGLYPPARCSPPFGNCSTGNSDTEPLIGMHNMLIAHAMAVEIYRTFFWRKQNGFIGIVAPAFMYEPLRDEERDRDAVDRALAFNVAWTFDPVVYGDYPAEMRHCHGLELPRFSAKEKQLLRGSIDFIGVNHYSTLYVKDCIHSPCPSGGDRPIMGFLNTTGYRDGVPRELGQLEAKVAEM